MFKKIKAKILKSIRNKRVNIFLLFLLMSFIILILTKLSKPYISTVKFGINKVNIPEEHVVFNAKNNQLKVSVKGQGFSLLQYYLKKPLINIDFTKNITKIDSFYVWNSSLGYSDIISQFDKDIEVLNINPDTLKFRYDVNVIKKIPVVLNEEVAFSQGYDLIEQYELMPDSIKIIGPESLLEEIGSIETDTLVLKDIKNNITTNVSLRMPEVADEIKFSSSSILVSAEVGKFTEGNLKVPIQIKNVPANIKIKYFPKKVNVSFYTSLQNFNSVKAEDFTVACDFSEVSDNQHYLIPKIIRKPENVRNVKMGQELIEYIITE